MKTYKKLYLLALLFAGACLTFSCSSGGDGGGGTVPPTPSSINITLSRTSVEVGESVSVTVKTNLNADVTSQADITVNGNAISGNSFSPDSEGTYTVRATYMNFNSTPKTVQAFVPITAITLALSATEVDVNNEVSFTVTANTGADLTDAVTYTVNGNSQTTASYTPTAPGSFTVEATFGSVTSNSETFTAEYPAVTSITLIASDESPDVDDAVTFTVMDSNGQDVTASSTVYANGTEVSGSLTSGAAQSFTCYATYESFTSANVTVDFVVYPDTYKRNVLIEDYTGTWCGYCPRINYALDLLDPETEHEIVVALHGSDQFDYVNIDPLENLINLSGYPTVKLNRLTDWTFPESDNLDQVTNMAGTESNIGLAISSTMSGSTLNTDVKVKYTEATSNVELVVYLLENGLVADQRNYYGNLYGGQDPIPNFIHNHTMVDVWTNVLGDPLASAAAEEEQTISFTETIPTYVQNSNRLEIVAFVIDASTNETINAQKVSVGQDQDYQLY